MKIKSFDPMVYRDENPLECLINMKANIHTNIPTIKKSIKERFKWY